MVDVSQVPKPPPDVMEGIVEGVSRDWEELVGNIWVMAARATMSALLQVPGFEDWMDEQPSIGVPIDVADSKTVPGAYEWVNAMAMHRMAKLAAVYDVNEHEEEE